MFELIPFREFSVANYVFTKKCARIFLLPETSLHLFHYITVKYGVVKGQTTLLDFLLPGEFYAHVYSRKNWGKRK